MLVLVRAWWCSDGTAEGACLLNTLQPGTALVASGYCLYSSSCMFVLTMGAGTHGQTQQVALPMLIAPNGMLPVLHCAALLCFALLMWRHAAGVLLNKREAGCG